MPKQLATIFITFSLFFLSLFIYTKLAGPIPFYINSVTTTKQTTFDVSGTGKVSTKPDIANVIVGVTATDLTVKNAQDKLNLNINKVSDGLKNLGIKPEDIKTENYNINPNYDFSQVQRITGYTASSNLSIKIRNLENVNKAIDSATSSGANQVGGVSYDVENKLAAENSAREAAIKEAKQKAQQAASLAGFKLGKIINYQESGIGDPRPMPLAQGLVAKDEVTTNIEPGTSDIQISVTLSFEVL